MRDRIFQDEGIHSPFTFDQRVASVFDDMIVRSVPCYDLVTDAVVDLVSQLAIPGDLVLDLGCSTGTMLVALAERVPKKGLRLIGLDSSAPMIEQAIRKSDALPAERRPSFLHADAEACTFNGAGVVILNYTLQFIEPKERAQFLRIAHGFLRPGGSLILSEKVSLDDAALGRVWTHIHEDFKRGHDYSETEIAGKRTSLEDVLIPHTVDENQALLRAAGFSRVEVFVRWFNWVSLLAIRDT
jgi:tRNA (cmo5U34)-methyltransferase